MKKHKDSFFDSFRKKFNSFVPVFILVLLVSNCVVIWYFEKSRRPQVIYSVERVSSAPPAVSLPSTNSVSSLQVPPDLLVDHVDLSSTNLPSSLSAFYDFSVACGRRIASIWGQHFREGDMTSYGEISFIYPERIILADGSVIVNRKWDGLPSSPPPSVSYSEGGPL